MARREQEPEPEHAKGAPEWMVTFSDCMTLLLTFFVLLLSFSSFDEAVYWKLKIIYSTALSAIMPTKLSNREALNRQIELKVAQEIEKGSEKPTLDEGLKNTLLKEQGPAELDIGRVILTPSSKLFWGKGRAISTGGRDWLALLALFLANVRNRVVISEYGPVTDNDSEAYGLPRAWAVCEHLAAVHGLDPARLSISASSALPNRGETNLVGASSGRTVEILLLDRSVYN